MNWFKAFGIALVFSVGAYGIQVGDTAPEFKALDQDGKSWTLSEQLGSKPLVVYFYPAAMTGGCTKQACSYRDYQINSNSAFTVVGISGDPVQNLKWFHQAEKLNFTLLSDPDAAIAKAFGVKIREGEKTITRQINGEDVVLIRSVTPSRWTFIIDAAGKVIYRDDKVNPVEDLTGVIEFLSPQD